MANNNINFGVDLLPTTSGTYSLGSSDKKWNIYATTINGQAVTDYIPLTGSNAISGSLQFNVWKTGIYGCDSDGTTYAMVYGGSNFWLGAASTEGQTHAGRTYISSGWDSTNNQGFPTIYINVPASYKGTDATSSNYSVLHAGNYTDYTFKCNRMNPANMHWGISTTVLNKTSASASEKNFKDHETTLILRDDGLLAYDLSDSNTIWNWQTTTDASSLQIYDTPTNNHQLLMRYRFAHIKGTGATFNTFSAVGDDSAPVYVDVNGQVTACETISVNHGGTGTNIAPNMGGVVYGASATAYASTATGTTGYYLISNGGEAPTWQRPQIYIGTCSTAAATAIKDVECEGYTNPTVGDIILVTFTYTNSAAVANLKLRVNSDAEEDAKPMMKIYNTALSTITNAAILRNTGIYQFIYDGTNWILTNSDYNSTYTVTGVWCNTAPGTAAKVSSNATYYSLKPYSWFEITMRYSNTAQGPLTLNVNSTGAKAIMINGVASSASNYTLPGGKYFVYYDGTNYHFTTNGRLTGGLEVNSAGIGLGTKGWIGQGTQGRMVVLDGSKYTGTVLNSSTSDDKAYRQKLLQAIYNNNQANHPTDSIFFVSLYQPSIRGTLLGNIYLGTANALVTDSTTSIDVPKYSDMFKMCFRSSPTRFGTYNGTYYENYFVMSLAEAVPGGVLYGSTTRHIPDQTNSTYVANWTAAGTAGQFLKSNGTDAPVWSDLIIYSETEPDVQEGAIWLQPQS